MEYVIQHKGIIGLENLSVQVDLKKLSKSAKNRSYPNLSPCHDKALKQKKFCSECNTEVQTGEVSKKLFKLGKEEFVIPAEHLNAIKESMDSNNILITEYRNKVEIDDTYYSDVLFAAKIYKKGAKEYSEFSALLQKTGKVAVGEMVYNSRPYPVMVFQKEGIVFVRALHFSEEIDDTPTVQVQPVNEEKIDLYNMALGMQKQTEFNISKWVNTREEREQELIQKVIGGEPIPEMPKVETINSVADNEEIARLKELLQAQAPIIEEV